MVLRTYCYKSLPIPQEVIKICIQSQSRNICWFFFFKVARCVLDLTRSMAANPDRASRIFSDRFAINGREMLSFSSYLLWLRVKTYIWKFYIISYYRRKQFPTTLLCVIVLKTRPFVVENIILMFVWSVPTSNCPVALLINAKLRFFNFET